MHHCRAPKALCPRRAGVRGFVLNYRFNDVERALRHPQLRAVKQARGLSLSGCELDEVLMTQCR
jgi:hypothetical protein